MNRTNLKLKKRDVPLETSLDLSKGRYAQPKPTSFAMRIFRKTKKFLIGLCILSVFAVIFFLIPFSKWDDYQQWCQIRDSLAVLQTNPDSLSDIRTLSRVAAQAGLLWEQPEGARPEAFYNRHQRMVFDTKYGIIKILALGLMKHDHESAGLREIKRLEQRTLFKNRPVLSITDTIKKECPECKTKGKISSLCNMCNGSGELLQTIPENPAPLQNNLIGTAHYHRTQKLIPLPPRKIRKKCPKCNGKGNITSVCPKCGGSGCIINYDQANNLYKNSITTTLALSENLLLIKSIIHKAAAAQKAFKGHFNVISQGALTSYVSDFDMPVISTNATVKEIDASIIDEATTSDSIGLPHNEVICLKEACVRLRSNPLNERDLNVVIYAARFATNNAALRNAAISVYELSLLIRGDTNGFHELSEKRKLNYPDEPPLYSITESDYISVCKICDGKGTKTTPCPRCMNPHNCKHCAGTGKIKNINGDSVTCTKCSKGNTVCKMCNGTKKVIVQCYSCKGQGRKFYLSDRITTSYSNMLYTLEKMCDYKNKDSP